MYLLHLILTIICTLQICFLSFSQYSTNVLVVASSASSWFETYQYRSHALTELQTPVQLADPNNNAQTSMRTVSSGHANYSTLQQRPRGLSLQWSMNSGLVLELLVARRMARFGSLLGSGAAGLAEFDLQLVHYTLLKSKQIISGIIFRKSFFLVYRLSNVLIFIFSDDDNVIVSTCRGGSPVTETAAILSALRSIEERMSGMERAVSGMTEELTRRMTRMEFALLQLTDSK